MTGITNNLLFRAMGTQVQISIYSTLDPQDEVIDKVLYQAKHTIQGMEELLSRFLPNSDVSRMNQHPGEWVKVDGKTIKVLTLAQEAFERTRGMFNPCLGTVMESMGYDVSFEEIVYRKDENRPLFQLPFIAPGHCPFTVNPETFEVFLEPGYKLDLGGIAKGWIVNQASEGLLEAGLSQFMCNAGGDVICRGSKGEHPWVVGIADPFQQDEVLFNLDVTDLSVATSGTYRRKWSYKGEFRHHLIDPYLGQPVQSDVISSTVIHSDLVEAEILAKVALLLGADVGKRWLTGQDAIGFVLVKNSGEVVHSCNL